MQRVLSRAATDTAYPLVLLPNSNTLPAGQLLHRHFIPWRSIGAHRSVSAGPRPLNPLSLLRSLVTFLHQVYANLSFERGPPRQLDESFVLDFPAVNLSLASFFSSCFFCSASSSLHPSAPTLLFVFFLSLPSLSLSLTLSLLVTPFLLVNLHSCFTTRFDASDSSPAILSTFLLFETITHLLP